MLDTTRALFAVLATSFLSACQFPEYDLIEVQLGGGGADSSPDEEPAPGGANRGGDSPSGAGSAATLPEDCRLVRGYLACAQIVNFDAAQAVCESAHRKLVRVDDAAENEALTDIGNTLGPYVWLGAKKEGDAFEWLDGTVFYEDGEVPGVYSNLVPPPSSEKDSLLRCVQLENSGAWTAAHCTDTQQFVCE